MAVVANGYTDGVCGGVSGNRRSLGILMLYMLFFPISLTMVINFFYHILQVRTLLIVDECEGIISFNSFQLQISQ